MGSTWGDFTKKSSRQQQLQLFSKTQKLENHHLKMRFSLSFLLVITLILGVLLPALEAASTRRRGGRVQKYRGGRSRPAFRRGPLRRRGRQEDEDVVEDDLNALDEDLDEGAADEAMEELYNGCDWKTNIGGFLNFCKWRKWCADNQGITDFGYYGGVPESCPPEEEGPEEADDPEVVEVEAEAPPPAEEIAEARRARARRGRKVAQKKKSFRKRPRSNKSNRRARKSRG